LTPPPHLVHVVVECPLSNCKGHQLELTETWELIFKGLRFL
jgi:hypothetical protein